MRIVCLSILITLLCVSTTFAQRDAPVWESYLPRVLIYHDGGRQNPALTVHFLFKKNGGPHEHVEQQGKIACGYFVSTVLRDAGWKIERVRLAQQASENIILSLTTNPFVKRFRRVPIDGFVTAVKDWGTGIYIVGLDIHVGFIVNTGDDVYFVHSSYVEAPCPKSVFE